MTQDRRGIQLSLQKKTSGESTVRQPGIGGAFLYLSKVPESMLGLVLLSVGRLPLEIGKLRNLRKART